MIPLKNLIALSHSSPRSPTSNNSSPRAEANWSLNPVSPPSHPPFCLSALRFLVWLVPGLPATVSPCPESSGSFLLHQSLLTQIGRAAFSFYLLRAINAEKVQLHLHIFVGKCMPSCSSDSHIGLWKERRILCGIEGRHIYVVVTLELRADAAYSVCKGYYRIVTLAVDEV